MTDSLTPRSVMVQPYAARRRLRFASRFFFRLETAAEVHAVRLGSHFEKDPAGLELFVENADPVMQLIDRCVEIGIIIVGKALTDHRRPILPMHTVQEPHYRIGSLRGEECLHPFHWRAGAIGAVRGEAAGIS